MRTRQLLLLLAVVAALVLTGCGDSADPASPPRASPTSTSSPSVSAAPSLPPAAAAHTKAGAIAFVRHYIALINYSQATGDVTALDRVEATNCSSCRSVRKQLTKMYRAGGWIRGGQLQVVKVQALRGATTGSFNVDVAVRSRPERVREADGQMHRIPGGGNIITVIVHPRNSGWVVFQWTRAK